MKDYKNIPLFLIPYATICAVLYHYAFWNIFKINGIAFINLSDILKSAIYPFISVAFVLIFNMITQNLIRLDTEEKVTNKALKKGWTNFQVLLIFFGLQIIVTGIYYFTKSFKSPEFWIAQGFVYFILFTVLLTNNNFLSNQFSSETLRRFAIDIIVAFPVFSYCAGKVEATKIFENISYKYCIQSKVGIAPNQPMMLDTLKYIGNTDKHFVFTDLKNSKVIFVKSDSPDTLILYDKP